MSIQSVESECWQCIGSREVEGDGKIYEFRLKNAYWKEGGGAEVAQNIARVQEAIYPAVEWTGLNPSFEIGILMGRCSHLLGYSYRKDVSGVYLALPDKRALERLFEKHIRQPLRVQDSAGIASDIDFAQAYFLGYDVLLSSGKEFVHDHIAHVLPTVYALYKNSPMYRCVRQRLENFARDIYCKIAAVEEAMKKGEPVLEPVELEKIKVSLGVWVDVAWSKDDIYFLNDMANQLESGRAWFFRMLASPVYAPFWARKFNGEKFSLDEHIEIWQKVEDYCSI